MTSPNDKQRYVEALRQGALDLYQYEQRLLADGELPDMKQRIADLRALADALELGQPACMNVHFGLDSRLLPSDSGCPPDWRRVIVFELPEEK